MSITEKDTLEGRILGQYFRIGLALNKLFSLAPDTCYQKDGIGCCYAMNQKLVDSNINGPLRERVLVMIRERGKSIQSHTEEACPYHEKDKGCSLGLLKPPTCFSHYCEGRLSTLLDSEEVEWRLREILTGNADESFVTSTIDYVDSLIEKIK